ncbi:MAG: 2-C-methyl-D-erythritol 4-phosphate cytidylyltransferase [Spirochaetes bacterium]|nr:MAG: 2-C-methyl-D-erythritol 4-phosphate cytidylyltransferase [Spirochaetota bacterium]
MSSTYFIILAGGRGARLGNDTPKQFMDLGGMPVIAWSMRACATVPEISGLILVCPEDERGRVESIAASHGRGLVRAIVAGGETRQGSVYNALSALPFADDDILLFHDAARPFIGPGIISRCVMETAAHGAAAVYVRATDTITRGDGGFVESIPPRDALFAAQTPQGFRYAVIRAAHERARAAGLFDASDDVRLVMESGVRVKMVEGEYRNLKITTAFDYDVARMIAGQYR